jgi:hypothetical protein
LAAEPVFPSLAHGIAVVRGRRNERFLIVPAGPGRKQRAAHPGMTTLYEFFNKRLSATLRREARTPCFAFPPSLDAFIRKKPKSWSVK